MRMHSAARLPLLLPAAHPVAAAEAVPGPLPPPLVDKHPPPARATRHARKDPAGVTLVALIADC